MPYLQAYKDTYALKIRIKCSPYLTHKIVQVSRSSYYNARGSSQDSDDFILNGAMPNLDEHLQVLQTNIDNSEEHLWVHDNSKPYIIHIKFDKCFYSHLEYKR